MLARPQERNDLRDRLAAANLELEQKEAALEQAYQELDNSAAVWEEEVKETKAQNDELKDVSASQHSLSSLASPNPSSS